MPTAADPLLLLAMDHRASFAKLFGDEAHPSGAALARLQDAKALIYAGLLRARDRVASGRCGVLVDEEFGGAEIVRAHGDGLVLAVPIEASGRDWFAPVWGDEWMAHVRSTAPDFAKVLVRDNPDLDPVERASQLERLGEVSRTLRDAGVPLICELLVPATPEQLAAVDGDADRYDREVRADLTVRVIADASAHDLRPELWKVEGFDEAVDARRVAGAAMAADAEARLIVLGRDAPRDRLDTWLRVAAGIDGFVGFAIGRSIWEDAIRSGIPTDAGARQRIVDEVAGRYLGFIGTWSAAREG